MPKIDAGKLLINTNANYDSFGEVAASLAHDPRLLPEERAALIRAHEIAVKRRLRDESPVLARFVDYVEGRGQPLSTKGEWQALKTLLGADLSTSEKDAIDLLAAKELFTPQVRDELFTPYRNAERDRRVDHIKHVGFKSGAAKISTIVASMGLAIGTSLVFPPALLALIPAQIFAQRKIDTAIADSKAKELGTYGVDRLAGREVDDENRLALSHLAQLTALDAKTPAGLLEAAQADVALVESLKHTRAAPDTPEAEKLTQAVDAYGAKLAALVAQQAKKPLGADALRGEIYKLRAEALAPDVVRAAVLTSVAANAQSAWPELQIAFADVQIQALGAAEKALAPGGLASPEQREMLAADADAILRTIETVKGVAPELINRELAAFWSEAAANPTELLKSDAAAKLKENLSEVRTSTKETLTKLEAERKPIAENDAKDIALQVGHMVFEDVLPRYTGVTAGKKKLKVSNVEDLGGGARRIELSGNAGKLSVSIAADGLPDARSIKLTVGEDRARDVARVAAERRDHAFTGTSEVALGAARSRSDGGFDVSGTLADGAGRFKVTVTAEGLPDLRTFTVS